MSGLPKAVEGMIADIIGRYCGVEQAEDIDYGAREMSERLMAKVCPYCGGDVEKWLPVEGYENTIFDCTCGRIVSDRHQLTRAEFIAHQEGR